MVTNARVLFVTAGFVLAFSADVAADRNQDKTELAKLAGKILKKNCHGCHGSNGSIEGGFNYILDRQRMVERRKLIPGDPVKSRIIKRIVRGSMPPEEAKQFPSREEIAVLKRWVAAGAPGFSKAVAKRTFISPANILESMHKDLIARPKFERPFLRYVTLTHLYNAGLSDDELQTYRHALSKLINSLSWARRIAVPQAIDRERTIFRIDLRHYQWDAKTWDYVVSRYPYAIMYESPTEQICAVMTKTPLSHIRGDWFVAAASQPPLYHGLLGLPLSVEALERELRIDSAKNIRTGMVVRAGFNSSGVSQNNRLIERHESGYGAYWKSYDFAGNEGRKNLFAHPLLPEHAGENKGFAHDGGEILFNLPNGLQAYFLTDAEGRRIDKGPTKIVSDPKRPDRAVVNGLSCMSCHSRGMITRFDQVRPNVKLNKRSFTLDELERIDAVYQPKAKLEALFKEDTLRFESAVKKTGATLGRTEPIVALARRFEAEVDLALASAESGLSKKRFVELLKTTPAVARVLGPLSAKDGTVQRETYLKNFPALVRDFQLGKIRPLDLSVEPFLRGKSIDAAATGIAGGGGLERGIRFDGKGKGRWSDFFVVNGSVTQVENGIKIPTGQMVSKKNNLNKEDFIFEVVFEHRRASDPHHVTIGFGAPTVGRQQAHSFYFVIYPHNRGGGIPLYWPVVGGNSMGVGKIPFGQPGPHRAIIKKRGDALTLSVDLNNDGKMKGEPTLTVPNVSSFAFMKDNHTHITLQATGAKGEGTIYRQFRFQELRSH